MSIFTNVNLITDYFKDENLSDINREYVNFHKYRYQYLLRHLKAYIEQHPPKEPLSLLDVGPSFLTRIIRDVFPQLRINSLGYQHNINNPRQNEIHYTLNLNFCEEQWDGNIPEHNIIIFCEVIEHLYTNPKFILAKLYQTLPKNGMLIIQTPNAVAIHKRIRMLAGINPFQSLQDNLMGHFREYTQKELEALCLDQGFTNIKVEFKNYFNYEEKFLNRLFLKFEKVIPHSWRDGLTLIAKKSS